MSETAPHPFIPLKALGHRDRLDTLSQGRLPPPVTVEIDLADGFCNHSCPHCFFSSPAKDTPTFFPLDRAASLARELRETGVRAIEFPGGGEPTTHPQFGRVIEAFATSGLPLGLVTNGQLGHRILPVVDAFDWIRVSVDAGTAQTYHHMHGVDMFDEIVANIHTLAAAHSKGRVGVGFLVTPENWRSAHELLAILASSRVRYIQYRPASLVSWLPSELSRARQAIGELVTHAPPGQVIASDWKWNSLEHGREFRTCETSSLVAIVKANGDVPFCCLKRDEPFSFGSVLRTNFKDLWFTEEHRELARGHDVSTCPVPCKHDSYNRAFFAVAQRQLDIEFL